MSGVGGLVGTLAIAVLLPRALPWVLRSARSALTALSSRGRDNPSQGSPTTGSAATATASGGSGGGPAQPPPPPPPSLTPAERWAIYALLAAAGLLVVRAVALRPAPVDLLAEWGAAAGGDGGGPGLTATALRRGYTAWMRAQFPGWPDEAVMADLHPDDRVGLEALARLHEALQVGENRAVYRAFGHDAFVDCGWCKEQTDYTLFVTPGAGLAYAGAVALALAATSTFANPARRTRWRLAALAALACVSVFEVFAVIDCLDTDSVLGGVGIPALTLARHYAFAACAAAMAAGIAFLKGNRGMYDDGSLEQKLAITVDLLQGTYQRSHCARVVNQAILSEPALRGKLFKYSAARRSHLDTVQADPEYRRLRDSVMPIVGQSAARVAADSVGLAFFDGSIRVDPSTITDRDEKVGQSGKPGSSNVGKRVEPSKAGNDDRVVPNK